MARTLNENESARISHRFSIALLVNKIVPISMADKYIEYMHTNTAVTSRDKLYMHQLASSNPYNLDERSIFVGGVTESETVSKKVYRALQKAEVLNGDGFINTYKIDRHFTRQVRILSIVRQKELVNLLFWWEEECQRLRKLRDEEASLSGMIEESESLFAESDRTGGMHQTKEILDQLRFARERIRMKIRQRPSERRPDLEADSDDVVAEAFHLSVGAENSLVSENARQRHLPNARSTTNCVQAERLPDYYA